MKNRHLKSYPKPRPVSAKDFLTTVHVNVDNEKLDDAQFRDFIRATLPVVDYRRPENESE